MADVKKNNGIPEKIYATVFSAVGIVQAILFGVAFYMFIKPSWLAFVLAPVAGLFFALEILAQQLGVPLLHLAALFGTGAYTLILFVISAMLMVKTFFGNYPAVCVVNNLGLFESCFKSTSAVIGLFSLSVAMSCAMIVYVISACPPTPKHTGTLVVSV